MYIPRPPCIHMHALDYIIQASPHIQYKFLCAILPNLYIHVCIPTLVSTKWEMMGKESRPKANKVAVVKHNNSAAVARSGKRSCRQVIDIRARSH